MIEDKARESLEDDDANEETREMILTSLNARCGGLDSCTALNS